MGNPFTLQIFCPDGDPENMREVTKMGWTGTVFYISREFLTSGAEQYGDKLAAPGVYILAQDNDDDNDDLQTIYIGQSQNLLTRIGEHAIGSSKNFFQYIVCVTGNDINNVHCLWMEAHLIEQAKIIDRCTLDNRTMPSKPKIEMAVEVGIKQFLNDALQIFPIFEIKAFVPAKTMARETIQPTISNKPKASKIANYHTLRTRVVDEFQKQKNIKLLNRSKATFYDESKTIHVCCTASKKHSARGFDSYWFKPGMKWYKFLKDGRESYLLLAMAEQTRAIALSFDEFNEMKDDFSPLGEGDDISWYIIVDDTPSGLSFRMSGGKKLDASPYIFDINSSDEN